MTEREFEQLRGYSRGVYDRNNRDEEPEDGYFEFFKLRCLICLVLFLCLVAVDQQINLKENDKVKQVVSLIGKEKITVEECFQILE